MRPFKFYKRMSQPESIDVGVRMPKKCTLYMAGSFDTKSDRGCNGKIQAGLNR